VQAPLHGVRVNNNVRRHYAGQSRETTTMKTTTSTLLVVCSLAASALPTRAQLVTNGGFETPRVGPSGFAVYSAGQSFMGWSVDAGFVGISDFWPISGLQSVVLDGTMAQELATVPGCDYTVSWHAWFGGDDVPPPLTVRWGATAVVIDPEPPPFAPRSLSFTASDSRTRLGFSGRDYGVTLDEIAVVAVPRLGIASTSPTQAQITWPTNFADHVLEHATTLPATTWTAVTNSASILGGRVSVSVDTAGEQRVFRLRKP